MSENKPLIIANWKMKLSVKQSVVLAKELKNRLKTKAEIVLCPTFTSLALVSKEIDKSQIKLGGQDCFWELTGAFTGEVSPLELEELGCQYVIIGHSERRQNLSETDQQIHQKLKAVIQTKMTPIICVGETFDQRQQGISDHVIIQQLHSALDGIILGQNQQLIVAYEPVWVIGTGQAINSQDAEAMHQVIYQTLLDILAEQEIDGRVRIIYGGSVDAGNISEFVGLKNTSGVLVGSASIKAEEFIGLANQF